MNPKIVPKALSMMRDCAEKINLMSTAQRAKRFKEAVMILVAIESWVQHGGKISAKDVRAERKDLLKP